MVTEFNKKQVYSDLIQYKVEELIQLCNKEKMPIFISICVENNNKKTTYKNELFSSESNDIHLTDDKFPYYVNVINGFITVPPNDIVEISFDDED